MPVFKNEDNGTWYVMARYVNWKGERRQKCKRGFATKKEAQEWERMFQLQNASDLDMSFEAFTELYIRDVKTRLKENTWLTKEHIIRTKILPYFGKLKISEISTKEVIAYLIQFVRGKRHDYLEKKIQMADAEELLEDIGQMEARIVIEELLENQTREQLLLQEAQGKYPEWNKMSDERLMKALHTLRDEERKLIYQHVFEERTFEEMSRLNGLSEERCKGIYYYAIRKIRKVMGGEN